MQKWRARLLVIALLILLSGCASEQQKIYYQLPVAAAMAGAATTQGKSWQDKHLLWLARVTLPDMLNGNGLVYQTSEVSYSLANNHLWASPLEQQLANSLVADLNSQLPGWLVSATPLSDQQNTLDVTITRFNGRYDGDVQVSGEWLLKYQQRIIRQPFAIQVQQSGDGYAAMAEALAQAWHQAVQALAKQLQDL